MSVDDLYEALITDAEKQPENWNLQGRQTEVWKQYGGSIDSFACRTGIVLIFRVRLHTLRYLGAIGSKY